jgi:hypothetical protein
MIVTIFVLPYGESFVIDMICNLIVVLGVLIYVYVTPFLYACYNQTSNLGRVWGMCALGGVIL